jgi:hypothetical protein
LHKQIDGRLRSPGGDHSQAVSRKSLANLAPSNRSFHHRLSDAALPFLGLAHERYRACNPKSDAGGQNGANGGESVSQSPLISKLFFISAGGHLRSSLPLIGSSVRPLRLGGRMHHAWVQQTV